MTEQEFWDRARHFRWAVTFDGFVRCADGKCPLAAVTGHANRVCGPRSAADAMGLTHVFALRVAQGADDAFSDNREWLLEKLGVGVRSPADTDNKKSSGVGGLSDQETP